MVLRVRPESISTREETARDLLLSFPLKVTVGFTPLPGVAVDWYGQAQFGHPVYQQGGEPINKTRSYAQSRGWVGAGREGCTLNYSNKSK